MEISRFPNRLKSFRRRKGCSRKKIARLLGFSDTNSLYKWEKGERMPNGLQLLQLATIYEVMPHDLYEDLWIDLHNDESLLLSDETFNSNHQFHV